MKKSLQIAGISLLMPALAFAQLTNTQEFVDRLRALVANLLLLVAGIAVLAFFWGLAKFIFKASDEKAKEEGKNIMIWGLITLAVMMSVWGIIRFFQSELNLKDNSALTVPKLGS